MRKYEILRRRTCKKGRGRWAGTGTVMATALALLLFCFLLPLVTMTGEGDLGGLEETPVPTLPAQPEAVAAPGADGGRLVRVKLEGGAVESMPLNDYLWRVVAAEMPASFAEEALKAQTVAARTYALRKAALGEDNHPDADVCTDINCCQAYLDPTAAAGSWGEAAPDYTQKIAQAVADTDGLVMTYGGELIQAVFHSSSAGRTNDAVEVWGSAVPYLVGVDTPEGDEVPNYHTAVTYTPDEFKALFAAQYPAAVFPEDPAAWFQNPTYTASGGVNTIQVAGVTVSGLEVRSLCALRSAHFAVSADSAQVAFSVTAYGHGVGLSQYGANALAKDGAGFQEILTHYYTGVTVAQRPE